MPAGRTATVYSNGFALIRNHEGRIIDTRHVDLQPDAIEPTHLDTKALTFELTRPAPRRYLPSSVIVVFRAGITPPADQVTVTPRRILAIRDRLHHARTLDPALQPGYTNDAPTNRTLATLGVDSATRLFRSYARSTLASLHAQAQSAIGHPILDFSNAYLLHLTNASVPQAVAQLQRLSTIAYVSPNWTVGATHVQPRPVGLARLERSRLNAHISPVRSMSASASELPLNYAISSSAQSLLNATGIDSTAAYDEIEHRFHQLPGQGEVITNVSLGDLDDASAESNSNDPCNAQVTSTGPTTEIVGSQRYLDFPTMPLIPTYTSSGGSLNPTGEVCGLDPALNEVGLDFSMMAPLPDSLQRSGATGSGLSDLLGVAPGAQFRLIVPGTGAPAVSDIDAAFLAAAQQSPRPNVITASIGLTVDPYGYASRFLEDDPLTEAIVSSLVHSYGIVVCISAGDGLKTATTAAVGPDGGSAATNVVSPGGTPSNIGDVELTTSPSQDYDSGSIDVGGTTLDDGLAAWPQSTTTTSNRTQTAYAETRWDGSADFSSGIGTRVNVSAPSDNILAFEHNGTTATSTAMVYIGGTSASAPQAAATAAVLLQVARLTGHPFTDPDHLRSLLQTTGSSVALVPQGDPDITVGPQIDERRAVETLLNKSGQTEHPSVPRVAIAQRRELGIYVCITPSFCLSGGTFGNSFVTDTDANNINLADSSLTPTSPAGTDMNAYGSLITIAPDWEYLPGNASYELYVTGQPHEILAKTPSTRLLPKSILAGAGIPFVSSSSRTVNLTYRASLGSHTLAENSFALTFGPADATTDFIAPPDVPPVVTGTQIPVHYDLRNVRNITNPYVVINYPGVRIPQGALVPFGSPAYPEGDFIAYAAPLSKLNGSVNIPVSVLQGGGIYTVEVCGSGVTYPWDGTSAGSNCALSNPAFVRVQPSMSNTRPPAPLISVDGSLPSHTAEFSYGSSVTISYDVTNVPHTDGAMLEVSAPGPSQGNEWNTFDNPNGTIRDNNGFDTGSVFFRRLSGRKGSITLSATTLKLDPTDAHSVRIIPMNGSVAAGEASDTDLLLEDGLVPADGGQVQMVTINPNGTDGLLISQQTAANGDTLSSLEAFDPKMHAVTRTIASYDTGANGASSGLATLAAGGIFGNDLGMYTVYDGAPVNQDIYTVAPVVSASPMPWGAPQSLANEVAGVGGAVGQSTLAFATLQKTPSATQWGFFTWQSQTNTFSSVYPIANPQSSVFGFNADMSLNTAALSGLNGSTYEIETFDTTNGSAKGTFPIAPSASCGSEGVPGGGTLDPVSHKLFIDASVTSNCSDFYTFDLSTNTESSFTLPASLIGSFLPFLGPPTIDGQNQRVLFTTGNGGSTANNYNEMDNLAICNEQLQLTEQLSWFAENYQTEFTGSGLAVDPLTRTGYIINEGELAPFTY